MSLVCDSRGHHVSAALREMVNQRTEIAASSKKLFSTFEQAFASKGCKGLNLLKEQA